MATLYLAKQSMFGTSLQKSVFQNDLPDLDSLVQIKNRDNLRVRTVVDPQNEQNGTRPPGAFGDVLQFLATLLGI